ncbi:sortase [Helicobacter pylori]|uniref:sortase n=1 Tax=Helicobacter pylori TaxID=210 RepID=UPI0018D1EE2C|nr:sortase [Helicobacter pylori]MBH0292868.1 sortase [Helicobacter pylori]MBH0298622.1 sortase [Helicobacter pylori]
MLEKAEEVIKAVASDCEFALARFEEKKCYIRNEVISEFSHHFNQLKGFELSNKKDSMEDIQLYVSDTLKIIDKNLKMSSFDTFGVVRNAVGGFSVGFGMVGGMAVVGGLLAAPSLAILGAVRADDMEEKLENAKAYYSQVEAAVKKADAMIDDLRSVEKMADLFTRQITKFDVLFFSLAQDAIATMKKRNYDYDSYNRENEDQLSVTVSTLMTLSAFLKVSIMDEHQKLNEKAQKALNLMQNQINALQSKRS